MCAVCCECVCGVCVCENVCVRCVVSVCAACV